MKRTAVALAALASLIASSSAGIAQRQERPAIPRESYADVVLWNFGEYRHDRQASGCLRWGTHTRTWYDVCQGGSRATVSVRN